MCKAMEKMREESMEAGIRKNMLDTAKRMLKGGTLSVEMIAEYSGLPIEEVLRLQRA